MTEEQPTLQLFWDRWGRYQRSLKETLAQLTEEQLALRPATDMRSLAELAAHIVASRAWWLHSFLGEGGSELEPLIVWDEDGAPAFSNSELQVGLDLTWGIIKGGLSRWSGPDLQQTFPLTMSGHTTDMPRSAVVWHMIQHDLLHGGEIALVLGLNGMSAPYM